MKKKNLNVMKPFFFTKLTGCATDIVFTAQPHDKCVYEGEDIFFHCEYSGTNVRPRWFINREVRPLPLNHRVNTTGLLIRNVDRGINNWNYSCFFIVVTEDRRQITISSTAGRVKVNVVESLFIQSSKNLF